MQSSTPHSSLPTVSIDRRQLLLGCALVVLFWLLDAAIDAAVFKEGSFFDSIFHPPAHELTDRGLVLVLVCCFLGYSVRASRSRESLESVVQEALDEAEQERAKLIAVVDAMGDGVSIQSPDFTVTYQNKLHQELMGSHLGEPCHLAYRQHGGPCDECQLDADCTGGVHRIEVRRSGEQGNRCFEIIASAARDKAGRLTAGIEVVREITEQKAAEQMARKQAALLQHLIDTIPNPIYYQDASGRFVWCNSTFADWLGKPREFLIARTMPEVANASMCRLFAACEPVAGEVAVREASLELADGELRDVIFYKSTFAEGAGDPGGVVGVIIDITARKRAEDEICGLNAALMQQAVELQQANRELEAFSHAISHDLRNPLTRIYSYAQLLEGYGDVLDANALKYVRAVNEGCLQVDALLSALMGLSKVTEVELVMSKVDLSRLAGETAQTLLQAAPERSVDFRISPGLCANGDRQLLQLALENLVGNAWKYTAKAAEAIIEIGCFAHDGDTVFYVRDNGAGFDSTRSEDLFKPFRRLHCSHDFPGTGLGLATVRRIIRRHNGRVWGESEPGNGATFYFTING